MPIMATRYVGQTLKVFYQLTFALQFFTMAAILSLPSWAGSELAPSVANFWKGSKDERSRDGTLLAGPSGDETGILQGGETVVPSDGETQGREYTDWNSFHVIQYSTG